MIKHTENANKVILSALIREVSDYVDIEKKLLYPRLGHRVRGTGLGDAKLLMYYLARTHHEMPWHDIKRMFKKNCHTGPLKLIKNNQHFIDNYHKNFVSVYRSRVSKYGQSIQE